MLKASHMGQGSGQKMAVSEGDGIQVTQYRLDVSSEALRARGGGSHIFPAPPPRLTAPPSPFSTTTAAAAALLLLLPLLLLPFEPPHGRLKSEEHDGGARHHPQQMGAHACVQAAAPFLHCDETQAREHGVVP